ASPHEAAPAEPEAQPADEAAEETTAAAESPVEAPPLPEPTAEQRAQQEAWCAEAETAASGAAALQARREVQGLRKRAQELAALGSDLAQRFDAAVARAGEREKEGRLLREREQFDNQARLIALCDKLEALAKAE